MTDEIMTSSTGSWVQIKVTVPVAELDELCAVMSMLDNSLMIEDYSDVDHELLDGVYGDLIDEEILTADRTKAAVSIYVPVEKPLSYYTMYLEERLAALNITAEIALINLNEEDWADSWKQYYKPTKVSRSVVIVPAWEKYDPAPGEVTVLMDPGMAFGTGTHETTRLCAALLEEVLHGGETVLDVGCGSGILSVCALKLGAKHCRAYDIDPVAVRVACEVAELNGETEMECGVSDLLKDAVLQDGGYEIVCANIVSDIIIRMAPDVRKFMAEGGALVISGVIDQRRDEVFAVLESEGLTFESELHENGWCGAVFRNFTK